MHICTYIQYTSQETLRVGNPQFIRGIIEDICRIIKGCPRNRQKVRTCEFVARGECTPMLSMLAGLSNSSNEEEDR